LDEFVFNLFFELAPIVELNIFLFARGRHLIDSPGGATLVAPPGELKKIFHSTGDANIKNSLNNKIVSLNAIL